MPRLTLESLTQGCSIKAAWTDSLIFLLNKPLYLLIMKAQLHQFIELVPEQPAARHRRPRHTQSTASRVHNKSRPGKLVLLKPDSMLQYCCYISSAA
jgi:hypothetical protein